MVYREGEVTQGTLPVFVGEEFEHGAARHWREQRTRVVLLERGRRAHVERDANALDERLDVASMLEVIGLDERIVQRVLALQPDVPGKEGVRISTIRRVISYLRF